MKVLLRLAMTLIFAVCVIQTAGAAVIEYDLTQGAGGRWHYDYTVTNALDEPIYAFEIFFDYGLYSGLSFEVDPDTWFEIDVDEFGGYGIWLDNWVVMWGNPAPIQDGVLLMMSDNGLALGETLLFSVGFNWDWEKGGDPYGGQAFNIYDAAMDPDNPLIPTGTTPGGPPSEVPEPGTLALLGTGLASLAAYYRRNRKR